jgi:hypothetical protein
MKCTVHEQLLESSSLFYVFQNVTEIGRGKMPPTGQSMCDVVLDCRIN